MPAFARGEAATAPRVRAKVEIRINFFNIIFFSFGPFPSQ
jgi:hypothetical protein